MGLRINTNIASLNSQRNLRISTQKLNKSLERLSTGYRINSASDDAAGLAISEKLKSEIRSNRQANRNANDGVSMVQTAEGALNEVSNMIVRLRELSVQAASDTIGDTERNFLDVEFQQLKEEIQRIAQATDFNGNKLLNGTSGVLSIQIGVGNNDFEDRIEFNTVKTNASLEAIGIASSNLLSRESARQAIDNVDGSLINVNTVRADLGALQNRLQSTINNLSIAEENLSAANSRIRDTDLAAETAELTKNAILVQAGTSVLSQANQSQAVALHLLSQG